MEDALVSVAWIKNQIDGRDRLVIWGHSLGAAVACRYSVIHSSGGMSRLGSHWPRASPVLLAPADLRHIEPARASKPPTMGFRTQNTQIVGYFACSLLIFHVIRIVGFHSRKYAIKNQRGARGLWMTKLVLYSIRLLANQFLGAVLDIEVKQSVSGQ